MTGKTKKKAPLSYGDKDVDLGDLMPHEIKIRISTMIDEDVVSKLKVMAKQKGTKYQTLINGVLKAFVENRLVSSALEASDGLETTVRRIVRQELRKRAG